MVHKQACHQPNCLNDCLRSVFEQVRENQKYFRFPPFNVLSYSEIGVVQCNMCYPFILKWSFSLKEDHPYGLRLDVIELPHILSIPNIGDVFVPRCVPLEEMQSFIFQTDVKSSNEFGIMVCVRYMNLLTFFERYPVSFKSVDSRLIMLAEVGNKVWLKTKGKRNWKKRQKIELL